MSSKDKTTAVGPTKTVVLLKPHTHAGRDYPPDAVLTLDADAADWLISLGTAAATNAQQEG